MQLITPTTLAGMKCDLGTRLFGTIPWSCDVIETI